MQNLFLISLTIPEVRELFLSWLKDYFEGNPLSFAPPLNDWETIEQHCERRKISKVTVHANMKAGMPYEKLGRATRLNVAAVDVWYKARQKTQKKPYTKRRMEGEALHAA